MVLYPRGTGTPSSNKADGGGPGDGLSIIFQWKKEKTPPLIVLLNPSAPLTTQTGLTTGSTKFGRDSIWFLHKKVIIKPRDRHFFTTLMVYLNNKSGNLSFQI